MKTLKEWIGDVHYLAMQKGWWDGFGVDDGWVNRETAVRRIPEALANVHAEVSEAWECYRSNNGDNYRDPFIPSSGKPEGFAVELADVVIRCFDLAGALGIDLERIITLKHEYNKTRPYRHGGKRA